MKHQITTVCSIMFFMVSSVYAQNPAYGWAGNIGKGSTDLGSVIYPAPDGFVYMGGSFKGNNVDFNIDPVEEDLFSSGAYNGGYISKYSIDGDFVSTYVFHSDNDSVINGTVDFHSICMDADHNIYVTGFFQGTTEFDPGPADYRLQAIGTADIFIAKYSNSFELLWIFQVGDELFFGEGNHLQLNNDGYLYVTGSFGGYADFNPDPGIVNTPQPFGYEDVFVAKYTTDGEYVWAIGLGGDATEKGYSMSVDDGGNTFVTGVFHDDPDFDPDPVGEKLLHTGGSNEGCFIAKYTSEGDLSWAYDLDNPWYGIGRSIVDDPEGNIYVTGTYLGEADFDPDEVATEIIDKDLYSTYLLKYSSDGALIWVKTFSSTENIEGYSLSRLASGRLYLTGFFNGTADMNPDTTISNELNATSSEIYIAAYEPDGAYKWAFDMNGTNDNCVGYNISNDADGNIFTTGWFSGTVDFDPDDIAISNFTSAGNSDIFVAKYIPAQEQAVNEFNTGEFAMQVNPNPVHSTFNLELDIQLQINCSAQIMITDIYGREILNQSSIISNGKLHEEIVFPELIAKGFYSVAVVFGDNAIVRSVLYN